MLKCVNSSTWTNIHDHNLLNLIYWCAAHNSWLRVGLGSQSKLEIQVASDPWPGRRLCQTVPVKQSTSEAIDQDQRDCTRAAASTRTRTVERIVITFFTGKFLLARSSSRENDPVTHWLTAVATLGRAVCARALGPRPVSESGAGPWPWLWPWPSGYSPVIDVRAPQRQRSSAIRTRLRYQEAALGWRKWTKVSQFPARDREVKIAMYIYDWR